MAQPILSPLEYDLTEEQRAALRPKVLPGVSSMQLRELARAQNNWLKYVASSDSGVALPLRKANSFEE